MPISSQTLHVENGEKKGDGPPSSKKIPCVSLGKGEMKCELKEWKGIKVWCRMTIMGNEHEKNT